MARKILLADDSVTAQNMGRKILADAGYEVITVNNGSAALKKILEIKPDLVILDVYMPGYSGLEVCQRLKETPDSAHVPVLLTVGKLEPFKPEEAQRVRAEAFIVKPFEASELLSTLSKLEDKVVPRSEPSKGGRFARAIASVEEAGRGRVQPIDGPDESGWKSRISFPNVKTEPEAKVEDDSAIYNPMNRDLRTVVASPSERVEEKKAGAKKEEEKPLPEMAVESSVDVAALAPAGVPQDVTPEEVAAIAAAAAQIQALHAKLNEENAAAEDVSPANVAEAATPEIKAEETSDLASSGQAEVAETQDLPVTMAAANGDTSRWTAVSVALTADEANISLEQEMQKAYATLVSDQTVAAEETAEAATVATLEQMTPVASSSQEVEAQATPLLAATAESHPVESNPQGEQAPAVSFAPPEPIAVSEAVSTTQQAANDYSAAPIEAVAATAEAETPASQIAEPVVADAPTEGGVAEAVAEAAREVHSAAQPESSTGGEVPANRFTSFVARPESVPPQEQSRDERHQLETAQEDVESVKSTAAAWASWRQVRDANESPAAEVPRQEASIPADVSVEAPVAMAVAAGAEKLVHEASQPTSENPADVASIVDSVLADLRPRLMAEISRKISEKK